MSKTPDRIARLAVDAFFEFHRAQPWKDVTDAEPVLIRIPDLEQVWVAVVLGAAGSEFGIALYEGECALVPLARFQRHEISRDEFSESATLLVATASRLGDIPGALRGVLTRAGFTGRRESLAPYFIYQAIGQRPRAPGNPQLRVLVTAMRAILAAREAGLSPRELVVDGEIPIVTASGSMHSPEVELAVEPVPTDAPAEIVPAIAAMDLAGIPRRDETWVVGLLRLNASIAGEDREPRVLLIADAEDARILYGTAFLVTDFGDLARDVERVMRGGGIGRQEGVPRAICFGTRGLYLALGPALREAGIECELDPGHPVLAAVGSSLADSLARGDRSDAKVREQAALEEWKEAELALAQRMVNAIVRRASKHDVIAGYFGTLEDGRSVLEQYGEEGAVAAMVEWAFVHYRPDDDSPTLAERFLSLPCPPLERALIRARIDAEPGFYRVDALDTVAGTLELCDVLAGGAVTVHDRGISQSAQIGCIIPLKLLPAGRFVLATLLGPPIMVGFEEMLAVLTDEHEDPREVLRESPEVLADLWEIRADYHEGMKSRLSGAGLQNTSGDPLVLVTASFEADDMDAALAAIRARPDIDDPEADEFVWLDGDVDVPGEGLTVLGRFERVGDELVLSVNSRERLLRAREWLEQIPGIRFKQRTERSLDPRKLGAMPPDDRLAAARTQDPPGPEILAAMRDHLRSHYMRWLDEPVPALGGKTPREVARTARGRERVARMIRSMGPTHGPGGMSIDPPREEMLRELGLE